MGWFTAVAVVLWVRRVGPTVPPCAAGRVSPSPCAPTTSCSTPSRRSASPAVWWASLALRVATYAVLAAGAIGTVLAELRRLEQYTDRELDRSDERLRGSLAVTDRLLDSAERFSRAVTPADVGDVVIRAALSLTGLERACVIVVDDETPALSRPSRASATTTRACSVLASRSIATPDPRRAGPAHRPPRVHRPAARAR